MTESVEQMVTRQEAAASNPEDAGSNPAALPTALRCMICTGEIPHNMAAHKAQVCSPECRKKLRVWRARLSEGKRCPMCYRPCTEGEKASWRKWRSEYGPLQTFLNGYKGNGNLHTQANELRKALTEALDALRKQRDEYAQAEGVTLIEGQLSGENVPEGAMQNLQELTDRIDRLALVLTSGSKRAKKVFLDEEATE
jgi:hypothetical protein